MQAWVEVDLQRLVSNYQAIATAVGKTVGIIPVVKSNAYGHGLPAFVETLDALEPEMFAVINLEEALAVKQVSDRPVLIMGYLDNREIEEAVQRGFSLSLYDKDLGPVIEKIAARLGRRAHIHLKLNTGFNRLGLSSEEAADFLVNQHYFPHLSLEALFSHLIAADQREENLRQLRQLQDLLVKVQGRASILPIHFVSSRALANFPEGYFDAVRIGLALFGTEPYVKGLQPILTCKSTVMKIATVPEGEAIGYGKAKVVDKDTTVAIVAAGYDDGLWLPHAASHQVLIRGRLLPVIGSVSMNFFTVEIGDEPIKRGDEVVIVGSQADEHGSIASIGVADLAKNTGLSHHEIVSYLGRCARHVYQGSNR